MSTDIEQGLREARKATGLSQQRVAELAGCSISMVRYLEAGWRPKQSRSDILERIRRVIAENAP